MSGKHDAAAQMLVLGLMLYAEERGLDARELSRGWPYTTPDDFAEFFRSEETLTRIAELSEKIRTEHALGYPDPDRGEPGDLNPCKICEKYGWQPFGTIWLCKEHAEWWQAERRRSAEAVNKRVCPQCGRFTDKGIRCWNCNNADGI